MFFINPKTELRESAIKGKGLFAKSHVKKGEIIHISEGVELDQETVKRMPKEYADFCYDIEGGKLLCPSDPEHITPDWYINHSCEPNCGSAADRFTLIAMRDIEPNEEITYDYAMTDCDPERKETCHCGSTQCRRYITGNDWVIRELQEKYKGYFQENVQTKIDAI